MSNTPYNVVELSHGKTRYVERGSGSPVIFLHSAGYLSGADNWWPILPALSRRHRCIAIDMLNFGLSEPFDREFSFAYLVDFVREFQDALNLEKTHIVGHSMGGWVGALLSYESPNRVEKFVDIAGGGMATRALAAMVEFAPPSAEEIAKQATAKFNGTGLNIDEMVAKYVSHLTTPEVAAAFGKVMKHMTDPLNRSRYHLPRRLSHVLTPTLVAWGKNDEVNNVSMAEEKHRLLRNSKLALFECGHFVPQEKPLELADAILDFLA